MRIVARLFVEVIFCLRGWCSHEYIKGTSEATMFLNSEVDPVCALRPDGDVQGSNGEA
jgi:hypothetical protein